MIYFFFILALIVAIVGIVGDVLPALPGVPLNYLALLIVWGCCPEQISGSMLLIWLLMTVVTLVLDYLAPIWMTKLGGGSKASQRWATAGMIAGFFFFMPWGLIVGPIIGAYLGEKSEGSTHGKSLKIAMLSFVAFLLTTGLKLACSLMMTYQIVVVMYEVLRR